MAEAAATAEGVAALADAISMLRDVAPPKALRRAEQVQAKLVSALEGARAHPLAMRLLQATRADEIRVAVAAAEAAFPSWPRPSILQRALDDKRRALQALEEAGGDGGADEGEDEMMCPVSLELMCDPVETESRKVYDRHTIEAWFATCRAKGEPLTDPMTKEELPSAKLRPKQALKERIRKYLKRHPERRPQWA